MDRINLEQRITENMKSVFGFALTRLGNVNEAENPANDLNGKVSPSGEGDSRLCLENPQAFEKA